MYSYGSPHMAAQKQDDQHERTFSSYVRIQVVVLKTYLGRWMIGRSGERGSGISVLPARYDDDDDDICSHFAYYKIQMAGLHTTHKPIRGYLLCMCEQMLSQWVSQVAMRCYWVYLYTAGQSHLQWLSKFICYLCRFFQLNNTSLSPPPTVNIWPCATSGHFYLLKKKWFWGHGQD